MIVNLEPRANIANPTLLAITLKLFGLSSRQAVQLSKYLAFGVEHTGLELDGDLESIRLFMRPFQIDVELTKVSRPGGENVD